MIYLVSWVVKKRQFRKTYELNEAFDLDCRKKVTKPAVPTQITTV